MADRIPTLGDLCNAIAEGRIAATIDGSMYKLSAFELHRYLHQFRSLPEISTALDQSASSHSDSDSWSSSGQISVA